MKKEDLVLEKYERLGIDLEFFRLKAIGKEIAKILGSLGLSDEVEVMY